MHWRERVKAEALEAIHEWWRERGASDRDIVDISDLEPLAALIADCIPSPDPRNGYVIVPSEPDTAMKRALLIHRGYDPDAKEETLDRLGQLDIATMGSFLAAYRAMIGAASTVDPIRSYMREGIDSDTAEMMVAVDKRAVNPSVGK